MSTPAALTAASSADGGAGWNLADPRDVRRMIRTGAHRRHTGSLAPGHVQANVAILPADWAGEFARFCQRNPKPCPLLAMSEPGDPRLPALGEDLDIRTDVPSYRVFRDGEVESDVPDISDLWRDDLVAFALGCSYSFEEAMIDAGLPLRHWVDRGKVPGVYVTDIQCEPAGRFRGPLVVSMRPFAPADAIKAIQITSRYPRVHGAPVHVGFPEQIGIHDLADTLVGDGTVGEGELPLFWACGITPQAVIREARPPLAITHTPAHMLVTDLRNAALAVG